MNKQLELLPYKESKQLKELGFDWNCGYWGYGDDLHTDPLLLLYTEDPDFVFKPTQSLAVKWFRDVHSIFISIEPSYSKTPVKFIGYTSYRGELIQYSTLDSYEQSELELIREAIKILQNK